MKSLYGAVGPQLLPEETSIRLEGGRATQWPRGTGERRAQSRRLANQKIVKNLKNIIFCYDFE